MIALVKFIHITAVIIWTAGLIALPGFFVQLGKSRAGHANASLYDEAALRIQRAVRFTYVGLISPAAFVAVASGIFLIFQRDMVAPWFSLKLALVAGLVVTHTLTGITLIKVFERRSIYPTWRYLNATGITLVIATAIIVITLGKPTLSGALLPLSLGQPGALKTMVGSLIPWQKP